MRATVRKFWCRFCLINTWQTCLPDVQGEYGLLWKCTRCSRAVERSAHQASMGHAND